nr:hypothetical protein [Micromonospora sp. DSM 115978]
MRAGGGAARDLMDGLLAGAAGSTALNAVTYLDMAIRARPASDTPQEAVRRLAGLARAGTLASERPGPTTANRRSGLGPLLGYATGLATSAMFAAALRHRRPPVPAAAALLAVAAMLAADAPITALGISDPRRWSRGDWLADAVPHLAYGVVSAVTWHLLAGRHR